MSVLVGPNYFACRCSEKSRAECDWVLTETLVNVGQETSAMIAREVTKEDLLDNIVWALALNYRAHFTGIATDQWHGVYSETEDYVSVDGKYQEVDPPVFKTRIQCDRILDGFAATYLAYYQKFGWERDIK